MLFISFQVISFSFTSLLLVIITLQSFALSVFLWFTPKGKHISNIFLSCYLMALALHMGLNFLFEVLPTIPFPNITNTLGFLYGPLFLLYVRSMVVKEERFTMLSAFHFLPWILFTVLWLFTKIEWLGIFIVIQEVCYIVLTIVTIRNFQRALRQTQSRYHALSLNWLIQFLIFIIFVALIDGLNSWFRFSIEFSTITFNLLLITLLLFVNALVFKGLKQPILFGGVSQEEISILRELTKEKSIALEPEGQAIAEKLSLIMGQQKPYLRPELSLEELSRDTGLGIRTLSNVINKVFKKNFSDYINEFRIKHAQNLLETTTRSQKTVSEIMYESGFNSKSSFYLAFRDKMGTSPSDYRKKIGK